MRRREFIGGFAALPSLCLGAHSQTSVAPVLIVILVTGSAASSEKFRRSFRRGLEELRYMEGRHYITEERFADGVASRLPALAAELIALNPKIVLTTSTGGAVAARNVSSEVPIVAPTLSDALGQGLIANQARPGSNVTGILVTDADLSGKQLALAHEITPGAGSIGVLVKPLNPGTEMQQKGVEAAAAALSIELVFAEVRSADDIEDAFKRLARAGVLAAVVSGDPLFLIERQRIAAAALLARLPTTFIFREHVKAGGLMSYGADLEANFRRAASHVDKILKGAKPAELPVELPTSSSSSST